MNTAKQRGAFISYSRKDNKFALDFARELKSAGYPVWLDQLDIPPGVRWDDEVERALHEHEIFLIILTPASVSSENVKDEIGYAIDHKKRIMPVLLEECTIPLRLRRFQYVDFRKMELREGIRSAKQLLESLLNEQSTPLAPVNSELEAQNDINQKVAPVSPLLTQKQPIQGRWLVAAAAILALVGTLVFRYLIFPQPPTHLSAIDKTVVQTPTQQHTSLVSTNAPSVSSITWTIDSAGVCRDDKGNFPNWSEYFGWTLSQCQTACLSDPDCQGFAMSKEKDYCQLIGSNGTIEGSDPDTQITHGDSRQPEYTCYLKSETAWISDPTGVCRDDEGGYPRWSEYYNWSFSQCQESCQNDPTCQGFAMSKERDYCQIYGSDRNNESSNPNDPAIQITRGDSSQPDYVCYIKPK